MTKGLEYAFEQAAEHGIEHCCIGDEAAARLARAARECCGVDCLVVSDENTRRVGGEPVVRALKDAGVTPKEHTYGPELLDASEELAREVAEAGAALGGFVAIGSGTLCDLAKYAASELGKPALLFATAASMNGYTSGIAALKMRGLKRTVPCRPALGVFADPRIVATAPQRMLAAGVGDFLSKCSASADWRTANLLREEPYDENALRFYEGIMDGVLDSAERVGRAEPDAVALVLEALLLSGLSMLVAGSSAPASGGEHLISHYLDMKHALYGTENDLHGTQTGVATVYCLGLWERVLDLDPGALDADSLAAAQPDAGTVETWIREDWGPVAPEVLGQWRRKARDREGIRAELALLRREFDAVREAARIDLLPANAVAQAIRAAGGPSTPDGLTAPREEFDNAVRQARYIRDRFTILDLAAELRLE